MAGIAGETKLIYRNKIYHSHNLDLMKKMPDNCIDLIATDPPYNLKFLNVSWDKALPEQGIFNEMNRVLKPGAFCFVFSSPRQDLLYRMIQRLENADFMVDFPSLYWTYAQGIGLGANVSKMIDKRLGVERKIIGTETPLAQKFDGAYIRYRPKSALEIILVAMKKCETKTYIEQVMKNGKACTWLDDVRIPIDQNDDNIRLNAKNHITNKAAALDAFVRKKDKSCNRNEFLQDMGYHSSKGRYPAHLIVSGYVLDTGKILKSGKVEGRKNETTGKFPGLKSHKDYESPADSGSFSRYFDFDLWCQEKLPKTYPFLVVPKPAASTKRGREAHLTEKPPQIFAYLIILASRPGDIVFDCFAGSGSCLLAAAGLNRDYLGCDNEKKHVKIAEQRLASLLTKREEKELK